MPGIDEFGLMDCQISCNSNQLGLGVVYIINAVGLVSDKVGVQCLIVQLLATRFLWNMTVNERPKFMYMADIGFCVCPGFVWGCAIQRARRKMISNVARSVESL